MQAKDDDSNQRADTANADPATGVLEGPSTVTILQEGKEIAVLRDIEQAQKDSSGSLVWVRYKCGSLDWSHLAAQLRLQGAVMQDLLGPAFVVLRGRHRPDYAPRPGLDDVEIVHVLENPDDLLPPAIFEEAFVPGSGSTSS